MWLKQINLSKRMYLYLDQPLWSKQNKGITDDDDEGDDELFLWYG